MRSQDIRERFLDFFANRGHLRLPSASLVTQDDPSVLFTVAGMVPFKPFFTGQRTPPAPRVTSCQKSFRTVDIEEVGRTARHHTFFEMLGNFSFGDYFKERAIPLAWELLTEDFGLDGERLWPSVHSGDAAAYVTWTKDVGVPAARMTYLEDNFWAPGPTGPCGFDSEVYWDWGTPCSCGRQPPDCRPGCDGDRFLEIWNLVFIEFDRDEAGTRTPLPRPSIDTGLGLERLAAVLQGVRSNFETDLFAPLVAGFATRAEGGVAEAERTVALRVLADHLRGSSFLVADGVIPGNEGRGYVLRRLIRRAALYGRRIGLRGGLAAGLGDLVALMADAYPELARNRALVEATLGGEERLFEHTLTQGAGRLESLLAGGADHLAGADAFRLFDTYGFPIELTVELAGDRGVTVDTDGFEAAMGEQRDRSRQAATRAETERLPALPPSTFVGYETLEVDATVVYAGSGAAVSAGEEALVVVEPTPFYAEAGGQVGDTGSLTWHGGAARISDTRFAQGDEVRVLVASVESGTLRTGERVHAAVDARARGRTARHHSATHLLNQALREVLGAGVAQRGSYVGPDYTTFDFSFGRKLTVEELAGVQHRVNDMIRANLERSVRLMPTAEARQTGALAMVGERYPDTVRVVDFGGWSRELCGGTHVARTGDLGAAVIRSESSIGLGTRRIDMVVGEAAEEHVDATAGALREVAATLRTSLDEVPERVAALNLQVRRLQRELDEARRSALSGGAGGAELEEIAGLRVAHLTVDADRSAVVAAADSLFGDRLGGDGVAVVLGSDAVAVKAGGRALERGADAAALVRAAAAATGARGGGTRDRASGGIADRALRPAALDAVRSALRALDGHP